MTKTDLNSNFKHSAALFQQLPHAFTSSIHALKRKDGNDFDMPPLRLSDTDNKKFVAAINSIGLGKVDDNDLFFYSEPSEKFVNAIANSKLPDDQNLTLACAANQVPPFITVKTAFDQKIRTFIGSGFVKYTADNFGFSQDLILRATAAHELTHKTAFDFFPIEQSDKAELVADYVSLETADPQYRLLSNIVTRQTIGGFKADHYHLAKECAYQALQQTVAQIDAKTGKNLAKGLIENPLQQTDTQAQAGFDPAEGKNIKTFYEKNIDAFYQKYLSKIDGAPAAAPFARMIVSAFSQNMKTIAIDLVAKRKAEIAAAKKTV